MEAYSMDLRQRVVRACDNRVGSQRRIADLFGVSLSWVEKLLRRRRQTGSITPKPRGGGGRPVLDEARLEQLRGLVQEDPDATLSQLRDRLGLSASLSVIHRALAKLGLTYKRRRFGPLNRTATMCSGVGRIS